MNRKHLFAFVLVILISASSVAGAQSRQETIPPGDRNQALPDERAYTQNMPAENQMAPPILTIPVGTLITVRTTQFLSSDRNVPGDAFNTVLDQPVVVQGWVVARRGQSVFGRVAVAQKAGRNQDNSRLAVELNDLMLVDGRQLPIRTELAQVSGGHSSSQAYEKAAAVGTTTGIGAVIGAAAGGGDGAAIGAAVGAVAGIAGVLATRGRPTEIYPETALTFRLEAPVTISTVQSLQAFMPVTQDDYNQGPVRNPDRYPAADNYPPPPVYYPPYYYGWYAAPPYWYYGFYGYYGPRYYSRVRVYVRPGRHGRR
jgi:hypothetical protein